MNNRRSEITYSRSFLDLNLMPDELVDRIRQTIEDYGAKTTAATGEAGD